MNLSSSEGFLIFFVIGILIFLLIIKAGLRIEDFKTELRYIKSEINRTCGSERRYWQREKRRLWLSLIGFRR